MSRTAQMARAARRDRMPLPGSILQRTCACGNHSFHGGECEACTKNRTALHRHAAVASEQSDVPASTHPVNDHRFEHDFSRVRVGAEPSATERGGPDERGAGEEETPSLGERIGRTVRGIVCSIGRATNPVIDPLSDMSTFQSPGASGWRGAKFGRYRNRCARMHHGWDIHAPAGTAIRAVVTGRMTPGNDRGGLGQFVTLTSNANPDRAYRYSHLSHQEAAGSYCVGAVLGATGTTGNADADRPHLHFEVREGGSSIDPAPFLVEPSQVIEATGSAATPINHAEPDPC